MQHWTLEREADGLARLVFDKAGATTNTLSAAVLAELNEALDELDRDPPKGLVIASGKANGFIAGADIDEFGNVKSEADAVALVKRGWDTFERLADGAAIRRSRSCAASASAADSSSRSPAATASSSTSRERGSGFPR